MQEPLLTIAENGDSLYAYYLVASLGVNFGVSASCRGLTENRKLDNQTFAVLQYAASWDVPPILTITLMRRNKTREVPRGRDS